LEPSEFSADYEKPVAIGRIESGEVSESSGLAASPCQPDVLWTHNDSGDGAFIYAMTTKGKSLGTWRVTNARNDDWEDMSAIKDPNSGNCYLYLGDIGNNKRDRARPTIYRLKEPKTSAETASSTSKSPLETDPAEQLSFRYPDKVRDAETLMVNPVSGDIYVLTKQTDGPSVVYKVKPQFGSAEPVEAQHVGQVAVPAVPNGLLTGGSISPDAKHVVVCDYSAGYELVLGSSTNFDDIWSQKPTPVDLGDRKQGETIAYSADGRSIYVTSEQKNSPIAEIKRK
jgi:hypothetical protein